MGTGSRTRQHIAEIKAVNIINQSLKKEVSSEFIYQHQQTQNTRVQGEAAQRMFAHYFEGKTNGEKSYYTGACRSNNQGKGAYGFGKRRSLR